MPQPDQAATTGRIGPMWQWNFPLELNAPVIRAHSSLSFFLSFILSFFLSLLSLVEEERRRDEALIFTTLTVYATYFPPSGYTMCSTMCYTM